MPIIAQAAKKLRRDQKRTLENAMVRSLVRKKVKAARDNPSQKTLTAAMSALDKAAKMKIIHRHKASRLKSRLAKQKKK